MSGRPQQVYIILHIIAYMIIYVIYNMSMLRLIKGVVRECLLALVHDFFHQCRLLRRATGIDIVCNFNTAIQVDDDGSRPDALLRDRTADTTRSQGVHRARKTIAIAYAAWRETWHRPASIRQFPPSLSKSRGGSTDFAGRVRSGAGSQSTSSAQCPGPSSPRPSRKMEAERDPFPSFSGLVEPGGSTQAAKLLKVVKFLRLMRLMRM